MGEILPFSEVVTGIGVTVPILGAIFKAYLENNPIRLNKPTRLAIQHAIVEIVMKSKPDMLPLGTNDVTPPDAARNYTIDVTGNTEEEATGELQVTDPENRNLNTLQVTGGISVVHKSATNKSIPIDERNRTFLVAEQPEDNRKALVVYGLLVHRNKNEPFFHRSK